MHCFDKRKEAFNPQTASAVRLQMCEDIAEDLRKGNAVVCDDLHTLKRWRLDLLKAVSGIECRKVLVVMDTPVDECLRRNAKRSFHLPDTVIHHLSKSYEAPTLDEGWDEIVYVPY